MNEAGWLKSRRTVRVEWGDCDAAGIVFYPNYFRWMDASTGLLFELAGLGHRKIREINGIGIPLVDSRAQFLIPSPYGSDLEIESTIAQWGNKSFKVSHRFYQEGNLAAEGLETRIWAGPHPEDPRRLKAQPVPREVIQRFAARQPDP
ncbi:MAG: acyl-CoA thioesterase [Candidatus Binataceae bacterium]